MALSDTEIAEIVQDAIARLSRHDNEALAWIGGSIADPASFSAGGLAGGGGGYYPFTMPNGTIAYVPSIPVLQLQAGVNAAALSEVQKILLQGTVAGSVGTRVYATQALLFADLTPADDLLAMVLFDADGAKNGIYQKNGAANAGNWTGPSALFASVSTDAAAAVAAKNQALAAVAANRLVSATADGTANAIALIPSVPVNAGHMLSFRAVGVQTANLTIACAGINGGAAAPALLPNGSQLPPRYIQTNDEVFVIWSPARNAFVIVVFAGPISSHVYCDVVGGTSSAPTIRVRDATARFRPGLDGTFYEFRAVSDKGPGGAAITLQAAAGSILVDGNSLFLEDYVTQVPEKHWLAGDPVIVERDAVTGKARVLRVAPATVPRQPVLWKEQPTRVLPLRLEMLDDNRMIVRRKKFAAQYRNGYECPYSDEASFWLSNIAKFYPSHQTPPMTVPHLWEISAMKSDMEAQAIEWVNLSFSQIMGAIANTGVAPTAFGLAVFGDTAGSAAAINAGNGSGLFHGRVNVTASEVVAFNDAVGGLAAGGGFVNAVAQAANANQSGKLKAGDVVTAHRLMIKQTFTVAGPSNNIFATAVLEYLFGFDGNDFEHKMTLTMGPAAVVTVGYLGMQSAQWPNRCDWTSDLPGGPYIGEIVGYEDGSAVSVSMAKPRKVSFYRDNIPSHRMEVDLLAGFAPYKVDGVAPVAPPDQIIKDEDWGAKLYFTFKQNSGVVENVANKVYSIQYAVNFVRADTI
ncbi:MAG: hypothetical protein ACRCU5_11295 [Rhizobiaceae bacterium]